MSMIEFADVPEMQSPRAGIRRAVAQSYAANKIELPAGAADEIADLACQAADSAFRKFLETVDLASRETIGANAAQIGLDLLGRKTARLLQAIQSVHSEAGFQRATLSVQLDG